MFSEISQTEKDKYCTLSLICGLSKIKQTNDYNKSEREGRRGRIGVED